MQTPNYYTVLTPAVRYSDKISDFQKILFSEIVALCNTSGVCFASNKYFCNCFKKSKVTISQSISNLQKNGFITLEIDTEKGNKRTITICKGIERPIKEKFNTPNKENLNTYNKVIIKDNNTINKYNVNNYDLFNTFISYYKKQTGQRLRIPTQKTKLAASQKYKLFAARINDGYTLDDLKKVLDAKIKDWGECDKMKKYIRIATLYNKSNFEKYLDEAENIDNLNTNVSKLPCIKRYFKTRYNTKKYNLMATRGKIDTFKGLFSENFNYLKEFKSNFTNNSINEMVLFEIAFTSLGSDKLTGTTKEKKLNSFLRWYNKQSDYFRNKGDILQII
tara:strand:+ start:3255 stop:4256 length:1002 start_codon:yes stop_codon:yes gene_type:complete